MLHAYNTLGRSTVLKKYYNHISYSFHWRTTVEMARMYLPPDMQGFSVRTFWSTINVTVPSGKNLQCGYIIQIRLLALPGFHHQLFSCSADDLIGTL